MDLGKANLAIDLVHGQRVKLVKSAISARELDGFREVFTVFPAPLQIVKVDLLPAFWAMDCIVTEYVLGHTMTNRIEGLFESKKADRLD